jgi:hypothetical protein
MEKYQYTDRCAEISGFGGGYEEACRKMVIAGAEWLDEHPGADIKVSGFKNVFGLTNPETDDAKKLEDVMVAATGGDCTGAMLHATTKHVLYILHNGWDAYIREMENQKNKQS